ncbi:MAG: cell division protein DedD [Mesorhizobium sp. SCN 65-20]|nr:MAG: cell division protein DedD [Mesorhizobium sp. SCN 65-20]
MVDLTEAQRRDFEAAAFRRLIEHLRERSDVQNIDLMNLAGFCRNCLSNWYRDAAGIAGVELSKEESREIVYGMPYAEWQAKHQREATEAQKAAFEINRPKDH